MTIPPDQLRAMSNTFQNYHLPVPYVFIRKSSGKANFRPHFQLFRYNLVKWEVHWLKQPNCEIFCL